MKRTTCTIHLDYLKHNVEVIKELTKGAEIIAVIKSDAYGHGAKNIYKTIKECGIENFAVAIMDEGIELRKDGLTDPILILVDTQDCDLEKLVEYNLTQAIFSYETALKLNDIAKERGVIQPIAIKLDTGMSRVGFQSYDEYIEDSIKEIKKISELPNIKITSCFTHFANADSTSDNFSDKQFMCFKEMTKRVKEAGVDLGKLHVSNTPSILMHPDYQLDMVRPGDILYGLLDNITWEKYNFKEVMSWETYVDLVKEIPVGATVGYSRTFTAKRPTKVASLPIGFADGYSRQLSNVGYVVIRGKKAPIIGRVCMDQFMVDVTDIPGVTRGDEVKLLDGDLISIYKMAELANKDVDEIVLGVSKRVPRVYVK